MPHDEAQRIVGPDLLLLRQVHPNFIVSQRVSSQAFKPSRKDNGCLSIANGSKTEAKPCYERYIQKFRSAGVWAVTVAEVEAIALKAYDDPTEDEPAHGCVSFEGLSNSASQQKADHLVAAARARGSAYVPEPAAPDPAA